MTNHQMHSKEFLVGAVVGSLLGSVTALLIAPKAGRRLRQDICDTYCDISDKTHDVANQVSRKGRSLAKDMMGGCQTCDWTDKAKSLVSGWMGNDNDDDDMHIKDWLIGGLAGGVLGAVAGLLLAPKAGDDLRQDIADSYHDMSDAINEKTHDFAKGARKTGKSFAKKATSNASKWIDLAKHFIDEFSDQAQEVGSNVKEQVSSSFGNKRLNDVMDWANLGYRLWQGINKAAR